MTKKEVPEKLVHITSQEPKTLNTILFGIRIILDWQFALQTTTPHFVAESEQLVEKSKLTTLPSWTLSLSCFFVQSIYRLPEERTPTSNTLSRSSVVELLAMCVSCDQVFWLSTESCVLPKSFVFF